MKKIPIAVAPLHALNVDNKDIKPKLMGLRIGIINGLVSVNSFQVLSASFDPLSDAEFKGYTVTGSVSILDQTITVLIALSKNGKLLFDAVFKEKILRENHLPLAISKTLIKKITQGKTGLMNQISLQELPPNVYQNYLLAEYSYNKQTPDKVSEAYNLFSKVITAEPNYAPAYSGMAKALFYRIRYGQISREKSVELLEIVKKAINIDPENVEAYTTRALYYMYAEKDFVKAGIDFENALTLQKDFPTIYRDYYWYLVAIGEDKKAMEIIEEAMKYDPLSLELMCAKADLLRYTKKYEEANKLLKKVLGLDPEYRRAMESLSFNYTYLNQEKEALHYTNLYKSKVKNPLGGWGIIGGVAAYFGDFKTTDKALKKIKERERKEPNTNLTGDFFCVYTLYKGKEHLAMQYSEKLYHSGSALISIIRDPLFAQFRDSLLFKELAEKLPKDYNTVKYRSTPESILHIQSELAESLTIKLKNFVYAKADGNYSELFYLEHGQLKSKLLRLKINALEQQIEDLKIIRVHKSYVVNTNSSNTKLRGNAHKASLMLDNHKLEIPVSRSAFQRLKQLSHL